MSRYYKLTGTDGGEWPEDHVLQLGTIIRVAASTSKRPGSVFNHATRDWVTPIWTETSDPRAQVSA